MLIQNSLYENLMLFKNALDKNSYFEFFFYKFEPLLIKYARYLGDLDFKYFLAEALYNALTQIPVENEKFKEDKYIISYIVKSVVAEYIKIKDSQRIHRDMISIEKVQLSQESYIDIAKSIEFNLFLESFLRTLSTNDKKIFIYRFVLGYSAIEIGKILSISRQAVHKRIAIIKKAITRLISSYD